MLVVGGATVWSVASNAAGLKSLEDKHKTSPTVWPKTSNGWKSTSTRGSTNFEAEGDRPESVNAPRTSSNFPMSGGVLTEIVGRSTTARAVTTQSR